MPYKISWFLIHLTVWYKMENYGNKNIVKGSKSKWIVQHFREYGEMQYAEQYSEIFG